MMEGSTFLLVAMFSPFTLSPALSGSHLSLQYPPISIVSCFNHPLPRERFSGPEKVGAVYVHVADFLTLEVLVVFNISR